MQTICWLLQASQAIQMKEKYPHLSRWFYQVHYENRSNLPAPTTVSYCRTLLYWENLNFNKQKMWLTVLTGSTDCSLAEKLIIEITVIKCAKQTICNEWRISRPISDFCVLESCDAATKRFKYGVTCTHIPFLDMSIVDVRSLSASGNFQCLISYVEILFIKFWNRKNHEDVETAIFS